MGKKITKDDLPELSEPAYAVPSQGIKADPAFDQLVAMIEELSRTVDDLRDGFIELEGRVNELYLDKNTDEQLNAPPADKPLWSEPLEVPVPANSIRVVKNPVTFHFNLERLYSNGSWQSYLPEKSFRSIDEAREFFGHHKEALRSNPSALGNLGD